MTATIGFTESVLDQLAEKLVPTDSGCWEWAGGHTTAGYGALRIGGKPHYAHRVSYELLVGAIPEGLEIDHLCCNPGCCNPNHLEAVTHKENMRRTQRVRAQIEATHCPRGHPYDEENTYVRAGKRRCRVCGRERSRAAYLRKHPGARHNRRYGSKAVR